MRIVLSTYSKFHTFDLARQLVARGWLERIISGYPRFKLTDEGIPPHLLQSFCWPLATEHCLLRRYPAGLRFRAELTDRLHHAFEAYVAAHLPKCDLYMGLSSTSLKAGRLTQRRGGVYVCDRGSSHLRYQTNLLTEEYQRFGFTFEETPVGRIEQEEREYAEADIVTVPSTFAFHSFLEMGLPATKLRRIGYGVDLSRFYPVTAPNPQSFDVLFAGHGSLRKGVPYLLQSFACLRHPCKHLTFAGTIAPEVAPLIRQAAAQQPIQCLGPVPQAALREIMSRSHVLALPSIEEGLALVQAQALACGCPVVGTHHSGAGDLFEDGTAGFITPIRSVEAMTERLQQIADSPDLRQRMSATAIQTVKGMGGWDRYGSEVADLFRSLVASEAA